MSGKREKPYFIIKESGDTSDGWIASGKGRQCINEDENNNFVTDKFKVRCLTEEYGDVTRQITSVENISQEVLKLSQLSSAYVTGIGKGGLRPWYDDKFRVHYCYSTWQGEGQWREESLSQLGLFRSSNHAEANTISFCSVGSQSTSMYYPLIFIEDTEMGKTWFFEIESGTGWYIEIGVERREDESILYVEMNSAFYNNDGWFKNLQPHEVYETVPAVFGCVNGGTEEATHALIKYKRRISLTHLSYLPVCFNDYMNCIWGLPDDKKLIPIIDRAAEVGCEVFCMDAGWYKACDEESDKGLGDWIPNDKRYGKLGFSGIIKYISNKGMTPGVWLELDSITSKSDFYTKMKHCLLKRNGEFAGSSGRYIADFRCKEVREYMTHVFDMLYNMGVRYIKNDYNQTSGIGYDGDDAPTEELRKCNEAFYDFIDSVRKKYNDLIIENCGSGAMRSDGAIMPHFDLLSTSDNEYYFNNPSIAVGTMACIPPEKCGIWSYPYPLEYDKRNNRDYKKIFDNEKKGLYSDGEETVFNMVTSMLGVLYMSGHIEMADNKNTVLIQQGIQVYKEKRSFINQAYPCFTSGKFGIYENGFYSFGLTDGKKMILAVWRINSENNSVTVDLSKYVKVKAEIKIIYPDGMTTEYNLVNGRLTVKLNKCYSARMFEIIF